jgi:isopentenyl phosphate kinase
MKDLTIIKIGGSVITDKTSETPKANMEAIERISSEISSVYLERKMPMIIVHGVGSYGHPIVKRTGLDKGMKEIYHYKNLLEIQRQLDKLNFMVTNSLIDNEIPAFSIQPSSSTIMNNRSLKSMDLTLVESLLVDSFVPVLYGIPAYDETQRCSILSGDDIISYMATNLKAEKILSATNVDGVFTSDPRKNANARIIGEINESNIGEVRSCLSGSTSTDVTGGMLKKVTELLNVGIESQIINANVPGNIVRALRGERIGTIIKCSKS